MLFDHIWGKSFFNYFNLHHTPPPPPIIKNIIWGKNLNQGGGGAQI